MNLKNLHSVFFLGIGGIGMSAIARWFNHIGVPVYGYDKTPSPLTEALSQEGMTIVYTDEIESLPDSFKTAGENKLIVWTPAVPQNSELYKFFNNNGFAIQKRAAVLGLITKKMESVAIAGTHGKTTTSSMVAHLLKHAGHNTAAFLGGLTQNYKNNLILHDEGSTESPVVVVEADEFDRSFLHLHPDLSIVTSIDPDHLDIYGDAEQLKEGFASFIRLTNPNGKLIIHQDAYKKISHKELGNSQVYQYSLNSGNIHADNIKVSTSSFSFDYVGEGHRIDGLDLGVPGFHNIENALAAIAVAVHYGLSNEAIIDGIATYKGVKRRFEKVCTNERITYIDDYAHHPEEIKAFLLSVKAMYPGKKITAVFQPHLFTRTRDFASGFSESLSIADAVVLLNIYPARELPIEGITSEMLLPSITSSNKCVVDKNELIKHLERNIPEVLVTIGAGDIDRMVLPIEKWIKNDNA